MSLRENIRMRMEKCTLWNRILASVLVAAIGIGPTVYATAKSDAQNKLNEAQSQLDAQNQEIQAIENKRDNLQGEINELDAELVGIIASMGILDQEIADKQIELDETNRELEQTEREERRQYQNMKTRIRYMYENGNASLLEIVIGARDFADFLNRIEYAGKVYGHDRDLLEAYQKTCQQIADYKLQIEGDVAELKEMRDAYEEQEQEYKTMIAAKRSSMSDFDTQLASAKTLAVQYQSVISEQNRIIKAEEEKERQEEERRRQEEEERKEEERRRQEEAKQREGEKNNNNNNDTGNGKKSDSDSKSNNKGGNKNPSFKTNVSGSDVVNYACQFIGNPYVLGGTSLTEGCDCSGYVMSVYAKFGIDLPHSSYALAGCGSEVSYSNAQPGDLICYAGHVAIYMGGGQIVNASSSAPYPVGGIKTNTATYRQILTVRRVL